VGGVGILAHRVDAAVPTALADGAQQVARVDSAVTVVVPDEAGVGGGVEVVEGNQAVAVGVLDLRLIRGRVLAAGRTRLGEPLRRDGRLIDPDVQVEVGVVVVDAGVRVGHDNLG